MRDPETGREWERVFFFEVEYWPSNKIMLQLAAEHGDNSAVTKAAEAWLEENYPLSKEEGQ